MVLTMPCVRTVAGVLFRQIKQARSETVFLPPLSAKVKYVRSWNFMPTTYHEQKELY